MIYTPPLQYSLILWIFLVLLLAKCLTIILSSFSTVNNLNDISKSKSKSKNAYLILSPHTNHQRTLSIS